MKIESCTNEKIPEKLDDTIKQRADDLIAHVGTNDIINNVNFLTNVKKVFNKVSKESSSTSIAFLSIINYKDKTNIQKTLTKTNVRLKIFACKKELALLINVVLRVFIKMSGNFI